MSPVHELQRPVAKLSAEIAEIITRELQGLVAKFAAEIVEVAARAALRQLAVAFGTLRGLGDPDPIESRIIERVRARPGLLAEQINAALGTPTADLSHPLRQLVADLVLETKGSRQGIRYYLAGEPAGRRAARGRG